MNKACKITIGLYISIIIIYLSGTISYAQSFQELSTRIFEYTSAKVEEYGIRYEFYYNEGNPESICSDLFNELFQTKTGLNTTVYKEKNGYTIEFDTECSKGYIQCLGDEEGKVILNIIENKTLDQLQELKIRIERIVNTKNSSAMCYLYIKANIGNKSILETKDFVKNVLKKSGASNIKSSDISGGYSITAFTGSGTPMKVGKELIDINCAVCSYSSGNYVIIGIPVISTSY